MHMNRKSERIPRSLLQGIFNVTHIVYTHIPPTTSYTVKIPHKKPPTVKYNA